MPANMSFGDRLLGLKGFAGLKLGKIGIGPTAGRQLDRGYSVGDAMSFVEKMVKERECVVSDYALFRSVLEHWNPGRASWDAGSAPTADHSHVRIGMNRPGASRGIAAWKGSHQTPDKSNDMRGGKVTAANTQPVTKQEWDMYLAPGTAMDQCVRLTLEEHKDMRVMFVRDGHAAGRERMKLKRIEMGHHRAWDTLWMSTEV